MANAKVHPLALVEEGANIGDNVEIGPFCYIESNVTIGNNCKLLSHVSVRNGTSIKENAVIHANAVLGGEPQNNKHKGEDTKLVIGKNCVIREGVTMHKGSDNSIGVTTVGDNCSFFAYSHVAHDCIIGNNVVFSNNVMVAGHVVVGDFVILGGGSAIHQFVRIGHHAFVGGLAAVVGDLIPYGAAIGVHAYLGGLNLIGMKRAKIERQEIHNLRHAIAMLFDRKKNIKERMEDTKILFAGSTIVQDVIDFISATDKKRQLCTPLIKFDS